MWDIIGVVVGIVAGVGIPVFVILNSTIRNRIYNQAELCKKDFKNYALTTAHLDEKIEGIKKTTEDHTGKIDQTLKSVIEIKTILDARKESRMTFK